MEIEQRKDGEYTTFTVKMTMRSRWVPYVLGMFKQMQYLGGVGSSRDIIFFSDGDGDFRPDFEWSDKLPEPIKAHQLDNGNTYFDAG